MRIKICLHILNKIVFKVPQPDLNLGSFCTEIRLVTGFKHARITGNRLITDRSWHASGWGLRYGWERRACWSTASGVCHATPDIGHSSRRFTRVFISWWLNIILQKPLDSIKSSMLSNETITIFLMVWRGEVSIWLLPLVQVSHVDGPVVCSRGQTLRPTVDVGETETTAQRTLAAGRGQRAQTRAWAHRQGGRRQRFQLWFELRHRPQSFLELLQQQLFFLVQSQSAKRTQRGRD